MKALLGSTYLGPVQWYQKLHRSEHVWIECHDSFVKQTYRNRCTIATPQGPLSLTIPVTHGTSGNMSDTLISDHGHWQHQHWQALVSAYGESPFFEFYADDFHPFYERRWRYLFDYNMELTLLLCHLLDIDPQMEPTSCFLSSERWQEEQGSELTDYREVIRPKHAQHDPLFVPRPYYQVHAGVQDFLPNMSIVDLLFNMGNESVFFL